MSDQDRNAGPPNPSMAMASTIFDELRRNGVRHVVVCPGSRSTALAIAAARTPDVTVHVRHDERSAAFMALGVGRATGVPAVVVTTSGTAVANLQPAVAEAHAAGVGLLVVTADRPAELHDVGANQTLRQAGLLTAVTRWTVDLPAAAYAAHELALWRSTTARAVAVARGVGAGTPAGNATAVAGPVHVNLAFREPTVPGLDDGRSTATAFPHDTTGRADDAPWTSFLPAPAAHDRAGLLDGPTAAAVEHVLALTRGRRVLVVAGDTPTPIHGLDDLPWPVVAEPTAGPGLGTGLAHASLLLAAATWMRAHRPDLVVRLGHPTLSRAALVGLADVPTIQVTASGLVDPSRRVTHAVTASPAAVVAALADRVDQHDVAADWTGQWEAAARAAGDVVDGFVADQPSTETAVAGVVAGAVGRRPLVVGSSSPVRDLATWSGRVSTGQVTANRGLAGIDGTVSTAVGVATAVGPTVALLGDLAFLHDHNGLLVDPQDQPPLTLVVVDNDGGGLFHHVPAVQLPEFERLFATPHGRDLRAVAAAAGVTASTVAPADIAEALAHDRDRMQVLVVPTDRHASAAARSDLVARVDDAV